MVAGWPTAAGGCRGTSASTAAEPGDAHGSARSCLRSQTQSPALPLDFSPGLLGPLEGGRDAADVPARLALAPDRLPQRQSGLDRRRSAEVDRVPGDGPGVV